MEPFKSQAKRMTGVRPSDGTGSLVSSYERVVTIE